MAGPEPSLSPEEVPPPDGSAYMFVVQPENNQVTVLERVDPDRQPAIVSTARTRCLWCNRWCWLGDQTMQLVMSGGAAPMCLECATQYLPGHAVQLAVIEDRLWDGKL